MNFFRHGKNIATLSGAFARLAIKEAKKNGKISIVGDDVFLNNKKQADAIRKLLAQ